MDTPRNAEVFVSDGRRTCESTEAAFRFDDRAEFRLVKVVPDVCFQHIIGFGGAFTEASACLYAAMSEEDRHRFIEAYFGPTGHGYTLCRTPIQSSDFGQGSYSYHTSRFDKNLRHFSIAHDEQAIIPLIEDALSASPQLQLLASPWSPPAYMKTNRTMRFGGHLKTRYRERWARMMAKYARAYRDKGLPITRMTLQNEPEARQSWESCLMDAEEEAALAVLLRGALDDEGLADVGILFWDHNKERMLDRMRGVLSNDAARGALTGVAFHWYTGDHFEMLQEAVREEPRFEFIMTEGCVEYSCDTGSQIDHAEHYAHDIIGDLNAGAHGWIDWNLLLDEQGGPNHVGNFCSAPACFDRDSAQLAFLPSYTWIGHFARFIRPGAQRMLVSRFSDSIEATAWRHDDGCMVCVLLNRTDADERFGLAVGPHVLDVDLPGHSIATVRWEMP